MILDRLRDHLARLTPYGGFPESLRGDGNGLERVPLDADIFHWLPEEKRWTLRDAGHGEPTAWLCGTMREARKAAGLMAVGHGIFGRGSSRATWDRAAGRWFSSIETEKGMRT